MICIPITAPTQKEACDAIKRSSLSAECLELRLDMIRDANLSDLITAAHSTSDGIKIIVTCRRPEESMITGTELLAGQAKSAKMDWLVRAIELNCDFVDIELAEGLKAIEMLRRTCLKHKSRTQIIVSYHDVHKTPSIARLKEIFQQCAETKADVVKIVTLAQSPEDNLKILSLIPYALKKEKKIIAFAMGEKGRISRVLAQTLGSLLGFATLEARSSSAPGQLSVAEMRKILKLVDGVKVPGSLRTGDWPLEQPQNYLLLGNPVYQSLSPLMHNAALKKMGLEGNYSAYCVSDPACAIDSIRGMNIRGASVTIPFKVDVIPYLDDVDPDALAIGAVNTIVNDSGRLTGYNTDWLGLIAALKEMTPITDKTFVIIGAGGTAAAAVYAIQKEGGRPVIVCRNLTKGKILSSRFGCPLYHLDDVEGIKRDCLINTTPVGMVPQSEESPVEASILSGYSCVADVIYHPLKTKLLRDAEERGCRIIPGIEMFVHQGAQQLKLWTGKEPPVALMKKTVLERLNKK